MNASIKSLGIDQMSIEDRISLVEDIWDSVADQNNVLPLTDAQRVELQRRMEDDDSHPDDIVPWSDVRASTLARMGR